jgi:hypothetical protein
MKIPKGSRPPCQTQGYGLRLGIVGEPVRGIAERNVAAGRSSG